MKLPSILYASFVALAVLALTPLTSNARDFRLDTCWCDLTCTSSDGKSFSEATHFNAFIIPIPPQDEHHSCNSACTSWAANSLSAWAAVNDVCGRLTCDGTSHINSERHTLHIGPLTVDRTCPPCPNPQTITRTVDSNPTDVIADEIPTVLRGLTLASFHDTHIDRIFVGAVHWSLPTDSCCQLTGTVTVVLKALPDPGTGAYDITNDNVGIGLSGGFIGASHPVSSAHAGDLVTITLPLTPAIISSGHVTIWAQDDHSVESITVNLTGCCLTPNVDTSATCNNVLWNICGVGSVGTCDSTNPAFIGQSSFDLSCSDPDMSHLADCGKPEGNNWGGVPACLPGNSNASCINDWVLEGITGPVRSLPVNSLACGGSSAYTCLAPITALIVRWSPSPTLPACVRITGVAGVTPFDIDNVCEGDLITVPGCN